MQWVWSGQSAQGKAMIVGFCALKMTRYKWDPRCVASFFCQSSHFVPFKKSFDYFLSHTHIVAREQVPEKGSSRLRASVAKQTSTHQAAMAWWRCWIFSFSKKLIDLNMQNHPIISSYLNRLTVLFALFVFICFWHLSWLGKALETEVSASATKDIGRLQQFLYFGSITSSAAWLRGTSLPLAWVYVFEIFGSNTSQTTGWRDNMSK